MAFSGGVFSRLFSWTVDAANGVKIRADRMDQEMTGFATGLSTCITKDGQTTITANLPMAGFRHTGVGNGVARNDYAAFGQLQDQAGVFVAAASVGGTADAITLTPSPAITAYAAGQRFSLVAEATNTTAVTVATSGLTARAVTKEGSTALVAGDILIGALVTIQDDGTRYQLVAVNGVATKQGSNVFSGPFARGDGSELTIASDAITPAANSHTVDTESDAATDDLTDIDDANMPEGARLTLRANNTARTVVVKNGSGTHKIHTSDGLDYDLDDNVKTLELELRSGEWYEVGRSAVLTIPAQTWQEIDSGTLSNAGNLDIDFTPSSWRVIKIYLTDFLPATDGAQLQVRTSTDGGANYDQGASDYAWTKTQFNVATTFVESTGDPADDSILLSNAQGNQAGETANFEVTLFDPSTSARKTILADGTSHDQVGNFNQTKAGGENITAADVDSLRFDYTTGNIASGRYRVVGLAE